MNQESNQKFNQESNQEAKHNFKKLTIEDLIGDTKSNNNNQEYSYKIQNNQKKYSHTQKIKP